MTDQPTQIRQALDLSHLMTDQPPTEYWPAETGSEPTDEKRDRTAATLILLGAGWSLEEVDRVLREG